MHVEPGRFVRRCCHGAVRRAHYVAVALVALACIQVNAGSDLTDTEQRWIAAAQPVLAYARRAGLPVDIIVQPVVRPDLSPLSMAFIDGRCKLVLTMRGNPKVERHLDAVEPALQGIVIEAMTAHELGHCWRHRQGSWQVMPSAFAGPAHDAAADAASDGSASGRRSPGSGADIQREAGAAQRREEGFADLVGLAWTLSRHPAQYARVHDWLTRERDVGGHHHGASHDTALWVEIARDPAVFAAGGSLFEQALQPWQAGLRADQD